MNRKYNSLAVLVAALMAAAGVVRADALATQPSEDQETTVVVTATRTNTPIDQVSSSVTVITAKQLQETDQPYVVNALRLVPGLFINESGGPGKVAEVFTRGALSGNTLIMIDGVPVNDPSDADRGYDMSTLTVDNVDRIEVLRGAQSTLYGSNATAGVINIITKHGNGTPLTRVTLDGGSYGTADGSIESGGKAGSWGYSAALAQHYTAGWPSAALQPGDSENDGYRNTTFSGRVDKKLSDALSLDFTGRYADATNHYSGYGSLDGMTYQAIDDGLHKADSEQITMRAQLDWRPASSPWSSTAGASVNTINKDSTDQGSSPVDSSPYGQSNSNGRMYKLDWQSNYKASHTNLVTFGAETEQDRAQYYYPGTSPAFYAYNGYSFPAEYVSPRSITTGSGYAQDQITLSPAWFLTVGARLDDHQEFGKQMTYRAGSDYHLWRTGTTFKANYATGFKAPTLFQLYDPTYGNPALRPETDKSFDAGVEQSVLGGRGAVSATYFNTQYKDMIVNAQSYPFAYSNLRTAMSTGVEAAGSYKVARKLDLNLSYTYTHAHDNSGAPLLRRPNDMYAASLHYQWTKKLSFNATEQTVSDRLDTNGSVAPVTLSTYTLINLAAQYDMSPRYKLFARIDNVTNADYVEVYSYRAAGRGIYGGITAEL
ncbi:MAG: TonB-dependent receptor [Capsulimonadaceae bacterium]|nr:TonB-dependent receptor [Capsulimonadaceae bacterium]